MFRKIVAHRFDRVTSGKTRPCYATCQDEDGLDVEVILKWSKGCELGCAGLIAEAAAAMMAAGFGLPVPEPFLVETTDEFIASIQDVEIRERAKSCGRFGFGSKKLPAGFATWMPGRKVPKKLTQTAAEILAFDILIANPDRRPENPNCLSNGKTLAIFDHELSFFTEGIIGWVPPWESKGILEIHNSSKKHLFFESVKSADFSFEPLLQRVSAIASEDLTALSEKIPPEWLEKNSAHSRIFGYIEELINNAESALKNISNILK